MSVYLKCAHVKMEWRGKVFGLHEKDKDPDIWYQFRYSGKANFHVGFILKVFESIQSYAPHVTYGSIKNIVGSLEGSQKTDFLYVFSVREVHNQLMVVPLPLYWLMV